jgi:hypothetical protein
MKLSSKAKGGGALAALAASIALIAPSAASAQTGFATTPNDRLLTVNLKTGKIKDRTSLDLPAGVGLVGIDQRPSNGRLYGVADDDSVYRLSPGSGNAVQLDDGNPLTPAGFGGLTGAPLEGQRFGVDFNPTVDAIRIVSDAAQNLRVSVEDGSLISEDPDLNGGGNANIVSAAYTESQRGPAPDATKLFVLDSRGDRLFRQNPPDDGTLVNPRKVGFNVTALGGFDIAGANNVGYATTSGKRGTRLFRVKVGSGDSKRVASIGGRAVRVDGFTVKQGR